MSTKQHFFSPLFTASRRTAHLQLPAEAEALLGLPVWDACYRALALLCTDYRVARLWSSQSTLTVTPTYSPSLETLTFMLVRLCPEPWTSVPRWLQALAPLWWIIVRSCVTSDFVGALDILRQSSEFCSIKKGLETNRNQIATFQR